MARSMMVITTRIAGTDKEVKLDINQARAIGRETKRLLKAGVPKSQAKRQAVQSFKGL